jgi:hypothetical protein
MGSVVLAAVALLVFSVGILSTEGRVLSPRQNTSPWHTNKSSRMAEARSDELAPVQMDELLPIVYVLTAQPISNSVAATLESPLKEFVGVLPSNGLRAPPLV